MYIIKGIGGFVLAAVWGMAVYAEPASQWDLLPAQSDLSFEFTQAGEDEGGRFDDWEAVFYFDPQQLAGSRFDVQVTLASVDTGDDERDDILRSADMFAVKQWPSAHFKTSAIRAVGGDRYEADAELTIRDRTRPLPFPFELTIEQEDGQSRFRLRSTVVLKRLDFGVGQGDWRETTWIADEVAVKIDVTAVKRAE